MYPIKQDKMKAKCWPFLIGANKDLEFRAVVVPEIVADCGERAVRQFADAAFCKIVGRYFHCKWQPSRSEEIQKLNNGRSIDLVFRRIEATKELVGEGSASEILLDGNDRKLYLIQGIALESNISITEEQFNKSGNELMNAYKRFWKAGKEGKPEIFASIDLTVDIDESKHLHVTHQPTKYDKLIGIKPEEQWQHAREKSLPQVPPMETEKEKYQQEDTRKSEKCSLLNLLLEWLRFAKDTFNHLLKAIEELVLTFTENIWNTKEQPN